LEDLELLADYRQRVIQDTRFVKLAGIPLPRDRSGRPIHIQVPLDRVYIRIQAVLEETGRARREAERTRVEEEARDESLLACDLTDDKEAVRALGEYLYRQNQQHKEAERPKPIDPQDALSEHKRIAILGAPGAGKSTMLRYLARKVAEDANAPLPILVSLRDYATYCGIGGTESLYDFALDEVAKMFNYDKTNLLRAIGQADRILWLVDGLDEARGWREKVVGQIGQLPGDLVITSRPVGYQKAGLESLPHFEILPLETEDVDKFLKNWFGVLADQGGLGPEWVAERVSWLKDQLRDRPRIGTLTNNPLLLTFLVILAGEDPLQDLPTSRGELYQSYVEKLLNSWEVNRRPRCGGEGAPEFSLGALTGDRAREAALDGFYYIGWRLHFIYYGGKGDGQPTRESLADSLQGRLKERWNLAPGDAKITAEDVVDFWQEAGVLDIWRLEKREYLAFRHLTFEEYAAARGLAEVWGINSKNAWNFLRLRLNHYAWREPILLLAGMMDQDDLNELLRHILGLNHWMDRVPGITWLLRPTCLPHGPSAFERFLHRDLFLAGEFLVERLQIDANIKDEIISELRWLIRTHKIWLVLTLIAAYLLGLTLLGLFAASFSVQVLAIWDLQIFWVIAILWTFAWVGAFIFGRFPRILSALGIFLSIWSYFPDRKTVMSLLIEIGGPAKPVLTEALKDEDWYVRYDAREALVQSGSLTFADLVQTLEDDNKDVRREAANSLGKNKDIRAIPYLATALKDSDFHVRCAAAEALAQIGSPAVTDLVQALNNCNKFEHWPIINALVEIGSPSANALLLALKNDDKEVRSDAAEALGRIGVVQAVPDLAMAIKDGDWYVRRAVAKALFHIGSPAIPNLLLLLRDDNRDVRREAAMVLGWIGDAKAVPDLVLALKDGDWLVSTAAAEALVRIGSPAVPNLLLGLKDDNRDIRREAAKALGWIGDAKAVPDLVLALKDGDWLVSTAAAEALGLIGSPAVPNLLLGLKDDKSDVRREAAKALGWIGDVKAVPDLVLALKDGNLYVRSDAAESLGKIGDLQATPYLLFALLDSDFHVRQAAEEAISQIENLALPDLILAIKDIYRAIHFKTAKMLDWIISIQLIRDLIPAVEFKYNHTRRRSVRKLSQINDVRVIPDLLIALKDSDRYVRDHATEALGLIGSPAVPDLLIALKDDDLHIRRGAVKALDMIRDVQAIPDLLLALKDSDWYVRYLASEVLGNIGASDYPDLLLELEDIDGVSPREIADSVSEVKSPTVQDLLSVLKDDDFHAHLAASKAMRQIGISAVPDLLLAIKDVDRDLRMAAVNALGELAGKLKYLDEAKSVSHAIRWRLTDKIFDSSGSLNAYYSLNQAASRLAVLEVDALPANDPLSCPQSTDDSTLAKYAKETLKPKPIAYSVLTFVLALSIGIIVNKIPTDAKELFAVWAVRGWMLLIIIIFILILGALVFVLLDHKSEEFKKRA